MKKRILSLLLAMLMIAGTCFAAPVAFAEETDGAELTVTGGASEPGVYVTPGNTLNIYGQKKNTGKLTASGGEYAAGIGGADSMGLPCFSGDCGNVAIYSGFVAAVSGNGAAGIGGAIKGNGGMVMIYGGIVTSIGENGAAGIGPGFDGKAGLTYVSPDLVITAGDIRSEFKTVETVGNELYVHIAWEDAEEDDDDPYSGILGDPNDVNGDESVTIADVTCLLDMLAGDVAGYSDLNRDGSMTIADVTYLLDVLSGNTEA